jgi:acetyl-CoA synthetase
MFSTPALGSKFVILNENEQNNDEQQQGEVALVPPSIGLSTTLLNRDHHECYFEGMPTTAEGTLSSIILAINMRQRCLALISYLCEGEVLRRHGDEIEAIKWNYDENLTLASESARNDNKRSLSPSSITNSFSTAVLQPTDVSVNMVTETDSDIQIHLESSFAVAQTYTYYRAHGRCDDTMNLGGIKISSVEIERICNQVEDIIETAAVAISPSGGGPSQLVIIAVLKPDVKDRYHDQQMDSSVFNEYKNDLKSKMQRKIRTDLNPLFHIHEITVRDHLPRNAANKIMRRILRDEFLTAMKS